LNDPDATYYNPNVDTLAVESWLPARAKALPTSAVVYPTTTYYSGPGFVSHAETISYFLYLDATSGRNDLYTLYRRVNDRDSTVVAHNMWIPVDTNYFFTYSRTQDNGTIVSIPQASLPIYWNTAGGWADSIRVVQMRIAGLYRDVKKSIDITRTIYHSTHLLNAGLLKQNICGLPPQPALAVAAAQIDSTGAVWTTGSLAGIQVTWNASVEETTGEKDVASYVVERTVTGTTNWDVVANVVARGNASYSYIDYTFLSGQWTYGVVAVDCSPGYSSVASSSSVTNP
jgi:hypothetical protein